MRPTHPRPDRRSVLLGGAGAGAALLSGCALNNPFDSSKTPAAEAVRDLAPDVGVAVQAVAVISAAQAELDTLIAAYPALAAPLGPLVAGYQAYAGALLGAVPDGVDATSTPSTAPTLPGSTSGTQAQAELAARHTAATVRARLTGFAVSAESGSFARLLGTMAAGLSQQLVVLAR